MITGGPARTKRPRNGQVHAVSRRCRAPLAPRPGCYRGSVSAPYVKLSA